MKNYYSQFNEDALLDGLFQKIGVKNRWCVEIGAADGETLSNTKFFEEEGWQRVLVESDKELFNEFLSRKNCFNERISADNKIDDILAKTDVPLNFDLISIDIDGQEYYVWRDMIKYRPRVVVIEYSPFVDADYIPLPDTDGQGGENQAGLKAMVELMQKKRYSIIAVTPVNLICIASEIQKFDWANGYKKDSLVLKSVSV